jgi:polyhydroxybutyrate depolymerase
VRRSIYSRFLKSLFGAVLLLALTTGTVLAETATPREPVGSESGRRIQPQLASGDHVFELQHDGLLRRYIVHVPPRATNRRLPVMLALHGGGGSGAQFQRENRLDPVADREGFLAVYPDGTGPLSGRLLTWNSGVHCCGWARKHAVDDSGFLVAMLDDLGGRAPIDPRRLYVTGHSNGAMMAYRLAAEHADRVAAIVAVGGAMDVAEFRPVRPVAVLDIHSVDDPRALYAGGLGPAFPGTNHRVDHQPVERGLALWAANNGCDATPLIENTLTGDDRNPGQTATRLVYTNCRPDGDVEQLRLTGVGHGWPGVEVGWLRRRIIGPDTTLVNASEEAWAFASRFTR